MGKVLGIDFGTTNSVMSIFDGVKSEVILNREGSVLTSSWVCIEPFGKMSMGLKARGRYLSSDEGCLISIKKELKKGILEIYGVEYRVVEVLGEIFERMRLDAREYTGFEVNEVVIGVPAYFGDRERRLMKEGGRLGGFEVLRILNDTTASVLAYGMDEGMEGMEGRKERVLVYDLGGGSLSVSVVDIGGGIFEVQYGVGEEGLGGDCFDEKFTEWVIGRYNDRYGEGFVGVKGKDLDRLRFLMEKLKRRLSVVEEVSLEMNGERMKIHREDFEGVICGEVDRGLEIVEEALLSCGGGGIDRVLCMGKSSQVPYIQDRIKEVVGINRVECGVLRKEWVSFGVAIEGYLLKSGIGSYVGSGKRGLVLIEVNGFSLGVGISGGRFVRMVERNMKLPVVARKLFTTMSDDQRGVEVKIYQGEGEECEGNDYLGSFELMGIKKGKRGDPRIEIIFKVDMDGILEVEAMDLDTGCCEKVRIQSIQDGMGGDYFDRVKSGRVEGEGIIEFKRFKEIYEGYRRELDLELRREVEHFIKDVDRGMGKGDWMRRMGFLRGEIIASCEEWVRGKR